MCAGRMTCARATSGSRFSRRKSARDVIGRSGGIVTAHLTGIQCERVSRVRALFVGFVAAAMTLRGRSRVLTAIGGSARRYALSCLANTDVLRCALKDSTVYG